ncbi:MAG: hypothetical protein K2J62_05320 [Bacteroidales bacterium]|nr:hypothetical protein [Bacteroidales bacterium]
MAWSEWRSASWSVGEAACHSQHAEKRAIAQAVQRVFQSPAGRLEAGLQLLHHPHRHTGVGGHRYLVAVDAPVKEVKTRREEVRGERDGEGKRRWRVKERGVIPLESGCRSPGC